MRLNHLTNLDAVLRAIGRHGQRDDVELRGDVVLQERHVFKHLCVLGDDNNLTQRKLDRQRLLVSDQAARGQLE